MVPGIWSMIEEFQKTSAEKGHVMCRVADWMSKYTRWKEEFLTHEIGIGSEGRPLELLESAKEQQWQAYYIHCMF